MWFDTVGNEMSSEDWVGYARCLGVMLSGDALDVRDRYGEAVRDDTFLLLFNAHHEEVKFALPGKEDVNWEVFLDTSYESGFPSESITKVAGDDVDLTARS